MKKKGNKEKKRENLQIGQQVMSLKSRHRKSIFFLSLLFKVLFHFDKKENAQNLIFNYSDWTINFLPFFFAKY